MLFSFEHLQKRLIVMILYRMVFWSLVLLVFYIKMLHYENYILKSSLLSNL